MGKYNKLVRDKIPKIIVANGDTPVMHVLDDAAYRTALLNKLVEEASELRDSEGSLEERADVAEVLRAIDSAFGISNTELEAARIMKQNQRGGFDDKIWLDGVEE